MMKFGLEGRVVCVTGGASGIGRATALKLSRDGAAVAIVDRESSATDAIVEEIRALGGTALGAVADVRDAGALKAAADRIETELGPVDGLVACAATSHAAPAEAVTEENFDLVLAVNVKGMFLTCREFGSRMIARKSGSIVIFGSADSSGGQPGRLQYVASKHAVLGMARNYALEWGRHGVRVNCIAPGYIGTELLKANLPAAFLREVSEERTPLGRLGEPDEIAAVALMLLSDATSFMTGALIPVDGGLTAGAVTRRQGADLSSNRLLDAGFYDE